MPLSISLTYGGLQQYMNFRSSFYRYREVHDLVMNVHNSHMNSHMWLIYHHASSAVYASFMNPWLCLAYNSQIIQIMTMFT